MDRPILTLILLDMTVALDLNHIIRLDLTLPQALSILGTGFKDIEGLSCAIGCTEATKRDSFCVANRGKAAYQVMLGVLDHFLSSKFSLVMLDCVMRCLPVLCHMLQC